MDHSEIRELDTHDPFNGPDEKIGAACAELQAKDNDITIRAVASKLAISHTTISRNPLRRSQVERCAALQKQARHIAQANAKKHRNIRDLETASLKARIAELEEQVQMLTASHKAMIMAVGELGGIQAWKRFYQDFQGALDKLPAPDNVSDLMPR